MIRPYLRNIINHYKTFKNLKVHSGNETHNMHTKGNTIEIMVGGKTDKTIEKLFKSSLQRYQECKDIKKH